MALPTQVRILFEAGCSSSFLKELAGAPSLGFHANNFKKKSTNNNLKK
jgi:hypothetical protein